jgi:general secretion pathway protein E
MTQKSTFPDFQLSKYGISEETIADARRIQVAKGGSIVDILIQKKAITETDILEATSTQFDIPLWPDLPTEDLKADFTKLIPIQYFKKHKMVPLETPYVMLIAVNDPFNFQPLDDLRHILNREDIQIVLFTHAAILSAINFVYDLGSDSAEEFIQDMNGESPDSIISEIEETADLLNDTSDAPIIKLVNPMLSRAVKDRSSDIHIEPYQNSLVIGYRIDGVLYNIL